MIAYDFLLMFHSSYEQCLVVTFHSSYECMSCLFWDIQCRKISRHSNPGQGSIKVIESGTIR